MDPAKQGVGFGVRVHNRVRVTESLSLFPR